MNGILSKIKKIETEVQNEIANRPSSPLYRQDIQIPNSSAFIQSQVENLDFDEKFRIVEEFEGLGPINPLIKDPEVTEIIINGPEDIWFEKDGVLFEHNDHFVSLNTYENFIHRICTHINQHINLEFPTASGNFNGMRVQIIGKALTLDHSTINFRKYKNMSWTFDLLRENSWAPEFAFPILKKIINEKQNFLIIGGTGSGKTSVLSAFLQEIKDNERCVLLEDTKELLKPNSASQCLYSRNDQQGLLPAVPLSDLLKATLRLRPDRIIVGEVRGSEAKDLLMALSTGHAGSFGSLHADTAQQALLRLEMLIQQGSPQWSVDSIRTLIFLSIKYLVTVTKDSSGKRKLAEIHKLSSREQNNILLEKVF